MTVVNMNFADCGSFYISFLWYNRGNKHSPRNIKQSLPGYGIVDCAGGKHMKEWIEVVQRMIDCRASGDSRERLSGVRLSDV